MVVTIEKLGWTRFSDKRELVCERAHRRQIWVGFKLGIL